MNYEIRKILFTRTNISFKMK